jgi:hypothetical protein
MHCSCYLQAPAWLPVGVRSLLLLLTVLGMYSPIIGAVQEDLQCPTCPKATLAALGQARLGTGQDARGGGGGGL